MTWLSCRSCFAGLTTTALQWNSRTRPSTKVCDDVDKATVIVTGSSGFIGYAVARRLAERWRTIGFDRAGPPHPPASVDCVTVDLTTAESVRRSFKYVRQTYGDRISSVIHLAAYYDFSGEPSPKYEAVTVRGTQRLFNELQGFRVEQFIFSSTMLVHAPCEPGRRISEDSPLDPRWPYPESKVRTERLIETERGRIPAVLFRIAGVYDDYCHSIPLSHQIRRVYERWMTSHVFPGHISHGQAFLHLDDLVDVCVLAVDRRVVLPPLLPLLIGEPETLSYDELQHTFGRLIHGEAWETHEIPKTIAKGGAWVQGTLPVGEEPFIKPWMIDFADDHYALDITRARTLLEWEPRRSLREALPKMIAALKGDPRKWYRDHKLNPPASLEGSQATQR